MCRFIFVIFLLFSVFINLKAIELGSATIVVDEKDDMLALKMAHVLADDIQKVCGIKPQVSYKKSSGDNVIIGIAGKSRLFKYDEYSDIFNSWERFTIITKNNEMKIIGSDPRGLAYGVFYISEAIGVNPWYWWADLPVKKQSSINIVKNYTSKSPSIKYRGIFINDEDWGLKTWASNNFEKELGDIGPKTYDKVCELILRLKGNMLAPAMHTCTGAFYSHPESQKVASDWGIMITTSHCEPLLFNNAAPSEWDNQRDGEWNYLSNKDVIYKKLDDRIRETAQFDNIYTMGMRGLHDEAMKGSEDPAVRARTLEQVFKDQREILMKYKKKEISDISQIFVPYKETLDIYNAGLNVPEDITIVWPDDNYGYMKRVSNTSERKRKGGSGVYYHLSYLGTPHDYLWVCTTPPALMYEELMKAYDSGADRYWLLNVGDIKPMELGMQTFFSLAWNVADFSYDNINKYQAQWLSSFFGHQYEDKFQTILDEYYRLAWKRKPEYMGYEFEWDSEENVRLHDTDFSFHDGSAQKRLKDYENISLSVQQIMDELSEDNRIAFFQLLGFSVKAADFMNRKFLYAHHNHDTGNAGDAIRSQKAFDDINELMNEYNTMNNSKWNQMMSEVPPGFVAKYQMMPRLTGHPTDMFKLPSRQIYTQYQHHLKLEDANISAPFRLINGMGTDWVTLQLGTPFDKVYNPEDNSAPRVNFNLDYAIGDSVNIQISTVPVWPVDDSRSNRIALVVDGGKPFICENRIVEWAYEWKMQVLENRKDYLITFPLNKTLSRHTLSIIIIDPGQLIQEITYQ